MKFLLPLVATLAFAAQLKDVKSVYFYPMPGGFEQHLASCIAGDHVYEVVTDPKLADAVFTDQISDAFLYKLDHINTPPTPVSNSGSTSSLAAHEEPHPSTFTRGKGTIFLVDKKTKQVLWSMYEKPKDAQPSSLNRAAKKVIEKLEYDNGMKGLKQQ